MWFELFFLFTKKRFFFCLFYKWCMVFFIIHYCVQKWPFHRGIRRASGSPPRGTSDDSIITAAPTIQVGGKIFKKINKIFFFFKKNRNFVDSPWSRPFGGLKLQGGCLMPILKLKLCCPRKIQRNFFFLFILFILKKFHYWCCLSGYLHISLPPHLYIFFFAYFLIIIFFLVKKIISQLFLRQIFSVANIINLILFFY